MEIERKFLVRNIPPVLDNCNKRYIEQAYLCTSPTVRVRRDNDDYYQRVECIEPFSGTTRRFFCRAVRRFHDIDSFPEITHVRAGP